MHVTLCTQPQPRITVRSCAVCACRVHGCVCGRLVEPEPRTFRAMRKARPGALAVHSGVCSSHGRREIIRRSDGRPAGSMTMATVMHDSRKGAIHFRPARWMYNHTLAEKVGVPCAPLADLFGAISLPRVDAIFLDVEGGEAEAIASIDFERVRETSRAHTAHGHTRHCACVRV